MQTAMQVSGILFKKFSDLHTNFIWSPVAATATTVALSSGMSASLLVVVIAGQATAIAKAFAVNKEKRPFSSADSEASVWALRLGHPPLQMTNSMLVMQQLFSASNRVQNGSR